MRFHCVVNPPCLAEFRARVCAQDARWARSPGSRPQLLEQYCEHLRSRLHRLLAPAAATAPPPRAQCQPPPPKRYRGDAPDTSVQLPEWKALCARWTSLLQQGEPLRGLVRDKLRREFAACRADQQARLSFLSVHIAPNPFERSVMGEAEG